MHLATHFLAIALLAPAPATTPVEPPSGVGLLVGGSLLGGLLGGGLFGTGIVVLGVGVDLCESQTWGDLGDAKQEPDCSGPRNFGIGVLVPGLIALAAGGTMIGFGARNHARHRAWERDVALAPVFGSTPYRTPIYGFALGF
jgi:hypothetical protein